MVAQRAALGGLVGRPGRGLARFREEAALHGAAEAVVADSTSATTSLKEKKCNIPLLLSSLLPTLYLLHPFILLFFFYINYVFPVYHK